MARTASLFDPPADPRIVRLSAALARATAAKVAGDTTFPVSLCRQWDQRRSLSDRQWPWVEKIAAELEATLSGKPAPVAPTIKLSRLAETFLSASASLKFPKLRMATEDGKRVVLSVAGPLSKEPGSINVTDGGRYGSNVFYGRIAPDGTAALRDSASADVIALLQAYDADPAAEAKVQGVRTGRCMCCGLELTDPVSVRSGIGPICADKWGIPRS